MLYDYLYDYIENYLNDVVKISTNTITNYTYSFIKLIRFFDEVKNIKSDNISIEMLNAVNIEEFISWMVNQGLTGKTINNRMVPIRQFLKYVSNREPAYLMLYSQVKNIKKQKEVKRKIKYFNEEEIAVIFSQLNYKNKKELLKLTVFTLVYECALRVSEVCNILVSDIDERKLEITIRNGKGNKTGTIPISLEAYKIIQLYISTYEKTSQDYLFTNRSNKKYSRWGITYIYEKIIENAKNVRPDLFQENVSIHGVRHSRAMHLLNNESNPVPLTTIQKLLRHEDISSTTVYAEASPKTVRNAIDNNTQNIKIKRRYNLQKSQKLEEYLKKFIINK